MPLTTVISRRQLKLNKSVLEIDDDDFIEYIGWAYSSQKTFIRSIRIATKNKRLLVHEGEIELKNQNQEDLLFSKISDDFEDEDDMKKSKSKRMSKSAICAVNKKDKGEQKIKMMYDSNIKSYCEEEFRLSNRSDVESSFEVKYPSLVDFYLKNQSCNLKKLNLKVIGFKSYFNGYLESIEVYAETVSIPTYNSEEGSILTSQK